MKSVMLFEKYELFEDGRIYSHPHSDGNNGGGHKGMWIKKNKMKIGYYSYSIKNKTKYLHRLIAENFIDNPNNLRCVNHINGIKTDNRVENLEWCTHSHNNKHAYDTGIKPKLYGKDHKASKPVVRLSLDGKLLERYDSAQCAQRSDKNIYASAIYNVCNGKFKTHNKSIWMLESVYEKEGYKL